MDFFKLYNDTYGHQAGDECLKKVAQLLQKVVQRPGDLAARYGGEEFIIVMSNTDSSGVAYISEKLRAGVENLKIVHKTSSVAKYITISLGCATMIPAKNNNRASLVKAADEALYHSKQNGRNRITTKEL